jgi:hypothetical protein
LIDPFRLCLTLGPVAIYVLLVGLINLGRRPLVVSGTRDAAALGLAVSGLVIAGPVELLLPDSALLRFGSFVWVLLISLYALCLVLVLLLLRPRLVIYNISSDELRPILAELAGKLDPEARWAGESLVLPNLGVQLHVDGFSAMRNVSLVASGAGQSHQGWRQLERAVRAALSAVEVPRNVAVAISFISAGTLLAWTVVHAIARDPQAVAQAFFKMLRM